ncbi:MAG: sigma 54-interacting transcriptional regulator [Deltaproteobacteria bacterium]|nr:sigma 54-interacting transcriptional regulator [Deltaproteobacteria bacterium]
MAIRLTRADGGLHTLSRDDAIVGRDDACDVVLDDPAVSGRHGFFKAGAAGWSYTDLGSLNGSALSKAGGPPVRLPPGTAVPIEPGDELLVGAADRPVRLRIEDAPSPFAPAAAGGRTVLASAPAPDLLSDPSDATAALAARAISAATPAGLASAAAAFLRALLPGAEAGVTVAGSGFSESAGDPVPDGLASAAGDRGDAVLLAEGGAALPATGSVAATGARTAAVAPLIAAGTWHGVIAAWTAADLPRGCVKPLSVAASLLALAARALSLRREAEAARDRLEGEVRDLRAGGRGGEAPEDPIGASPAFREVSDLCRRVAPADVPVLLVGETGTGKEVLARAVHRWSRRAGRPFVAFNCAAVPGTLLESELFGHVRGAYSGAASDRAGLFEEADGGTVLLDEIGEMPPDLQPKLLRFLQDGEVRRLGANRPRNVDVRVLAATNRDLGRAVEAGLFRADLLYRLNVVTARIPPLRERGADVPVLAHFMLARACRRTGRRVPGFAPEALAALQSHDFPGNVRELENEVLRAVALTADGEPIRSDAFSPAVKPRGAPGPGADGTLKAAVEDAERRTIEAALACAGGNVAAAARDLGLTRPGLYKVMERTRQPITWTTQPLI